MLARSFRAASNVTHPPAGCLKGAGEDLGDRLEIARGNRGPRQAEDRELVRGPEGWLVRNSMRYQFDQFELDADRYELRLNGVAQHVEPLVFDLIVFFAANAGRLVGREEIVERVWRGRAVRCHDFQLHQVRTPSARGQWRSPGVYPNGSRARLRVYRRRDHRGRQALQC